MGQCRRPLPKRGPAYMRAQPKTIFRDLLDLSATVTIEPQQIVVSLDKRAHDPYLVASGLLEKPTRVPWLGNKQLLIRIA